MDIKHLDDLITELTQQRNKLGNIPVMYRYYTSHLCTCDLYITQEKVDKDGNPIQCLVINTTNKWVFPVVEKV